MDVLHLLRSRPDQTVTVMIEAISGDQARTVELYDPDLDWDKLVRDIFAAEKVISWW